MYKDMALPGGGASSYSTGPPLALYDLIGQKGPPISYAYSCDMSVLGEEDEEEQGHSTVPSDRHNAAAAPPSHGSDRREEKEDTAQEEQKPIRDEPSQQRVEDTKTDTRLQNTQPPQPPPLETRPEITQRETFPLASARRPNWQTIRYQTVPGRAHKAQLEAWVGGWSAAVSELGDETYCACADSTAARRRSSSSSSSSLGGKDHHPEKKHQRKSAATHRGLLRQRSDGGREGRAAAGAAAPAGVSFVCRNCARQPSPAVIPDQEFAFPPAGGAGRMAMRCKLVWKRIVGRASRRQCPGPDEQLGGGGAAGGLEDTAARPVSPTPLSQAQQGGYGGDYDEEDDDDEEVDIYRLSDNSSRGGGGGGRAGNDIAERLARLNRAQRLLRKGSRGMREAG
ncbi:hypothetical protein NKR19_g7660 [Coniochaeta hoffmannii]|uniref:Uncharacterized protein n=1 Tax=Coniochaeta hoffmannii TaxID=91930 RepID=A0AA38R6T0_9PEZI|nr:hypothetical protein NKR19_g7660 [Coniochaeta hoffmannii]